MPAHNTIPHTAWRCTATWSHRTGERAPGRERDTVEGGRGKKKTYSLGTFGRKSGSPCRGGSIGGEGGWEKVDLWRQRPVSPHPPTPPCLRGWRRKKRETTLDGFWQSAICCCGKRGGKKSVFRWLQQLCGNSKDDANHLWVTSFIHHPCYSSSMQHRPSGKANHAHIVCKSLSAVFHCGWKLSKFHMRKAENLLPQQDTLSDQAICD